MPSTSDVLILGSGVTGLSAAWSLGDRAILLEREARPGGLVRTERFGEYWFDRVLHLLYFQDPETETRTRALLGDTLVPCPPVAWCETASGTTRFPFQMHLNGLDPEARVRCVLDLAKVTFGPRTRVENFEQHLLATFGRSMCELFLFPYNRKMWRRPLDTLAPSGFTWNITAPEFEHVLRGAISEDDSFRAYNSAGWYPQPPAGSALRGMECLAAALAGEAADLRCGCEVLTVDPARREVTVLRNERRERLRYREALLSTLPLPALIERCGGVPLELRRACSELRRNRVLSIAVSVCGPRPEGCGHWRYYADESLAFTRLIFLHQFDPLLSPADGWSLLVEITEPAEAPRIPREALLARVRSDLERCRAMPPGSTIVGEEILTIDPAYVVFDLQSRPVVEAAHRFLSEAGVTSLGRFGRWEYSSMASCMRDGRVWSETLGTGTAGQEYADIRVDR